MNIDLTKKIIQRANKQKPRVLHRYNCSEIWSLLNGYLTPENWLRGEIKDFKNAYQIEMGKMKHRFVQELLPEYEQEIKEELKVGDITIVGMADLLDKDRGYEIKTSEKLHNKAKSWHSFQAQLYCVLFNRPEWVIVQPVLGDNKLYLKEIGRVKKSQDFFNKTMKKLKEKDDEITKVNEKLQILREDKIAEEWKDRQADLEPEARAERQAEERETNDVKEDLI